MSLLEVKQTSRGSASAGRTIKPRSLIALPRDPTIGLTQWADAMGYNRRNYEIRDNIERMRRYREAYADALVLAHDCRRAHFKTSLVGDCVRQLRHDH
jgi:hypothetical protein